MNLKGLIESLEKLATGGISKDDRGKFYRRLLEVANRFLQQSSLRLKTRLHALTALTAVFTNVRLSHDQPPFLKEADNLLQFLFIEISKILIGVEFLQLEDDNLTKRLFKKTIADTSNLLKSIPNQRFFEALNNVVQTEWSHPTLLSVLRGDEVDKETVLTYVKNEEHEDIVRLRIEALMASDCEDLAQKLLGQCLTCDIFMNNPNILLSRFQFLYKSGNLEDFYQLCSKTCSSTACEVLSKAAQSNCFGANPTAALLLAQTFYLTDWVQPGDLKCSKFLLRNWMVLESHIGLKEEFGQALDKVLALAHSAKQLVIFIDVAEELFGFKFAELCSTLGLRAIQQERHRLDCARLYVKDVEEAEEANRSLAEICYILVRLYRGHPQMNLCCLLSWFYLCPSENGYFMLERYHAGTTNELQSTMTPPPTVDDNTYTRLYHAVELLRPDLFRASYQWQELKPIVLCHMNHAGYRYDVGGNRFIKSRQKTRSLVITQENKGRNVNMSGHLVSEFSKESNGLPPEVKTAKSEKPVMGQASEMTKVQLTSCVKDSKTESDVTTTSSKSDLAESIERLPPPVSSTSVPPHGLPSDGSSVVPASETAATSPVVVSSGNDAVNTAAPCLVVPSVNDSVTAAASSIAVPSVNDSVTAAASPFVVSSRSDSVTAASCTIVIPGNGLANGELLSAVDGNDPVMKKSEADDAQNSNADLHKSQSCNSVQEDEQLKDCDTEVEDGDDDEEHASVSNQQPKDHEEEEAKQSSPKGLHDGAYEVDKAQNNEQSDEHESGQHDEEETGNYNDQESRHPHEQDTKQSDLQSFPNYLETTVLQLSKEEFRPPDEGTSQNSNNGKERSTDCFQLATSCCLGPEANVFSQHSEDKAAGANAASDMNVVGNVAFSCEPLSTGSYQNGSKSQSLDMVSMLQQSQTHAELVLLVSHSRSMEPSHCLDLVSNNNNQILAVPTKHQVRTVWSDNISSCDGSGLDIISTKLVSSINAFGSAVSVDCADESIVCQRSLMSLPATSLKVVPYSPKPTLAVGEIVFEVDKAEPSAEVLPLVANTESPTAKAINGSVPGIATESFPVGEEECTFNKRQLSYTADDDVSNDKTSLKEDSFAMAQSSPDMTFRENNCLNKKPLMFIGDVLASGVRQLESENETSKCSSRKSGFLKVDNEPGLKDGKSSDEFMTTEADFRGDLKNALLPDVHKIMASVALNNFVPNTEAAVKTDEEVGADTGTLIADEYLCKGDVCVSENALWSGDESLALEVDTETASIVDYAEHVLGEPRCTDDKHVASLAKDVTSLGDELDDCNDKTSDDCTSLAQGDISVEKNIVVLDDKGPALDDEAVAMDANVLAVGDQAIVVEDSQTALDNTFVYDMSFAINMKSGVHDRASPVDVKTSVESRTSASNDMSAEGDKAANNHEDVGKRTAFVLDGSGSTATCSVGCEEVKGISPWQNVSQSLLQSESAFARHLDTGWQLCQQKVEVSDFDMNRFPVAVIRTNDNHSLFVTPTNVSFIQTMFPNLAAIQDRAYVLPDPLAEQQSRPSVTHEEMAGNPPKKHQSTEPEIKNTPVSSEVSADSVVGKMPPENCKAGEQYQCNICNKVLNSSWGHRLHAIRVHQVDCVDELSPGKGYKCRRCHKLVALNAWPYKRRKAKAAFCTCKNQLNRKKRSMLSTEEGSGNCEVTSTDGLAQQQLDAGIASGSAIDHEAPQEKSSRLHAIITSEESDKERNSGATSCNDIHHDMLISELQVKQCISCGSCLPLTLCQYSTDIPVSLGQPLCRFCGDSLVHSKHCSADRLEIEPVRVLLSDSGQFQMNSNCGHSLMDSMSGHSKMDSKSGQYEMDSKSGQSEMDSRIDQSEMDSKSGQSEMDSKSGQSEMDSRIDQSEMNSKSGQYDMNSMSGQSEMDSRIGQSEMDSKSDQCEMDSKNGQSDMDSKNGQCEMDSRIDQSEMNSKSGRSEMDYKSGQSDMDSKSDTSEMDAKSGPSEMNSKRCQSEMDSSGQSEMDSRSGQSEMGVKSGPSDMDSKNGQSEMDSRIGQSEMDSKSGQSEMDSKSGQSEMDSESAQSEIDSRIGQSEMGEKSGQFEVNSKSGQSEMDSESGPSEMDSKSGQYEMNSMSGQSEMGVKSGPSELDSKSGQSEMDSKSGQSEMDSKSGQSEMGANSSQSEMDSKSGQSDMDSKSGQSEMDSKSGQSDMDSKNGQSEMGVKSGPSELDSKSGQSEMDSKSGQSEMGAKSGQSDMDSKSGQSEMDSKSGQSEMGAKSGQSDMDSKNGQSEMGVKSGPSELDSKSGQSDMDSKDGQYEMGVKSGPSELDSKNGQSEMGAKSGQSEMDSKSGQSEMDSKSGQSEMVSKSGQSEMDSKSGQSEMDSKSGPSELDSKSGQSEMVSKSGQSLIGAKSGLSDMDSKSGQSEMDLSSGQLEMDSDQYQTNSRYSEPAEILAAVSETQCCPKLLSEERSFSQSSIPKVLLAAGQFEVCSKLCAHDVLDPASSAVLNHVQVTGPLPGLTMVTGLEQAEEEQMSSKETHKALASDKIKMAARSDNASDSRRLLELDEKVTSQREHTHELEHLQSHLLDQNGFTENDAVITMVTSTAVVCSQSSEESISTCRNIIDTVSDDENRDSVCAAGTEFTGCFLGVRSEGDASDVATTLCTQSGIHNSNTVIQSADNALNTNGSCNIVDIKQPVDSEITKDAINNFYTMVSTDGTTSIVVTTTTGGTTNSDGMKSTSDITGTSTIADDHTSANSTRGAGTSRTTIDLRACSSSNITADVHSQMSTVIKLTVSKRPLTNSTRRTVSPAAVKDFTETTCLVPDSNISALPPANRSISSLDYVLTKVSLAQSDCASENALTTKTANFAMEKQKIQEGQLVLPSLNLHKGTKRKSIEGFTANDKSPESNRKRLCTSATSKTISCKSSPRSAFQPMTSIETTVNLYTISNSQNSSNKGMRLAKKSCDHAPKDYAGRKLSYRWTCTECQEPFSNYSCWKTHVQSSHSKSPNASGYPSITPYVKSCQSATLLETVPERAHVTSSGDSSCLGHFTTANGGQLVLSASTGQSHVINADKTSSNTVFSKNGGKTSNADLPKNSQGRSAPARNTKRKLNAVLSDYIPCSKTEGKILEKVPQMKCRATSDCEQSINLVQQSPVPQTSDSEDFFPGPIRFQGKTYSRKRQKVGWQA